MRLGLNLLWLVMIPACAGASGWDTNVWGVADTNGITAGTTNIRYYIDASTNKVIVKDQMRFEVIEAINERNEVIGGAGAFTSGFFRTSRVDLKDAKGWVIAHVDFFANTNALATEPLLTFSTNSIDFDVGQCDNVVVTQAQDQVSSGLGSIHPLSLSQLITDLSLPSNYFTSTPWRKLSDTNTANGWHHMDDVLNKLVFVFDTLSWSAKGETNTSSFFGTPFNDRQITWTIAKGYAESNETSSSSSSHPRKFSWGSIFFDGESGFCRYLGEYIVRYAYPVAQVSTQHTANVSYYTWVDEWANRLSDKPDGTGFYSGFSVMNPSQNGFLYFHHSDTGVLGVSTSSVSIGDSGLSQPTWCSEPTTNSPFQVGGETTSDGDTFYEMLGHDAVRSQASQALIDYASHTNGFTYSSR